MSSELAWIEEQLSQSGILVSTYIVENGIPHEQIQEFIAAGELERISVGLYAKQQGYISPLEVVGALQNQMHLDVHVAAMSSLVYQEKLVSPDGDNQKLLLSSTNFTRLPKWVHEREWSSVYSVTRMFDEFAESDFVQLAMDGHAIKVSCLELAVLECLEPVTNEERFENALHLMRQIDSIDVAKMQSLLGRSKSVKTNRLLMHLAEKTKRSWYGELNQSTMNFGEGDVQVIKDGLLDPKFNITVPAFYPA